MRKKCLGIISALALIILPNYFTNGGDCYFANWKTVDAAYWNSGGSFVLMCPADGIAECCVEKSENEELKQGN